jgi:hypothetical protein
VVNIANVPSREDFATLRQRAAEGLALRDELGERSVRIYFERDGLPDRFVFDAREEAGKPTGHVVPQPTLGPSTEESETTKARSAKIAYFHRSIRRAKTTQSPRSGVMMLPLNAALSMILFDLGAAFEKRCSEERRTCAGCLWPVTREDLPARPCAGYGCVPPMLRLE